MKTRLMAIFLTVLFGLPIHLASIFATIGVVLAFTERAQLMELVHPQFTQVLELERNLSLVSDCIVGLLYALFHSFGAQVRVRDGMLGGALASLIVRIIATVPGQVCWFLGAAIRMGGWGYQRDPVSDLIGLVGIGAPEASTLAIPLGLIIAIMSGALGALVFGSIRNTLDKQHAPAN